METAIFSLICIALLLFGGMTLSQNFLIAVDKTSSGLEQMSETASDLMRTELSPLTATMPSSVDLDVTLKNEGQTKLAKFDQWDVIVQYTAVGDNYTVVYLTYQSGSLNDNEWNVEGIYIDAGSAVPEVFERGILNPAEEIIIQAQLNPPVKSGSTNQVVVSTHNGVPAVIAFSG